MYFCCIDFWCVCKLCFPWLSVYLFYREGGGGWADRSPSRARAGRDENALGSILGGSVLEAALGVIWGPPLGHLGATSGTSWAHLGATLGPSWGHLGSTGANMRLSLMIWSSEAPFARSLPPKGPRRRRLGARRAEEVGLGSQPRIRAGGTTIQGKLSTWPYKHYKGGVQYMFKTYFCASLQRFGVQYKTAHPLWRIAVPFAPTCIVAPSVPDSVKKNACEPLSCNPAAETALHPLVWCFDS